MSSELIFPMDDTVYHVYDMITDTIAIGDYRTSYEPFDVIFNFNYPENGAIPFIIHRVDTYTRHHRKQIIYNIGLADTTEYTIELLHLFTNLLPYLKIEKDKMILFHCYAGISRSATAAILYFMMSSTLSLQQIINMILAKRPCIQPNPTFLHILQICNIHRNLL